MNRRALGLVLAVVVSVALAGCAPSTPAPDDSVTAQLEQTVLDVTVAVDESNWDDAAAGLDALEAQIDTALASGGLTTERAAEIRAAIELVRADIAAGIDDQEPEPTETPEPDKPGNGNGNGNKKP